MTVAKHIHRATANLTDEQELQCGVTLFNSGSGFAHLIDAYVASLPDQSADDELYYWLPVWRPVTFNAGIAIELLLKAYIVAQGGAYERMHPDYGHHLDRMLSDAISAGLALSIDTKMTIEVVGTTHYQGAAKRLSSGTWPRDILSTAVRR